jgi:hypothetical protein
MTGVETVFPQIVPNHEPDQTDAENAAEERADGKRRVVADNAGNDRDEAEDQ